MIRRRFARALRWLANELDPTKAEPLPRSWIVTSSAGTSWVSGSN